MHAWVCVFICAISPSYLFLLVWYNKLEDIVFISSKISQCRHWKNAAFCGIILHCLKKYSLGVTSYVQRVILSRISSKSCGGILRKFCNVVASFGAELSYNECWDISQLLHSFLRKPCLAHIDIGHRIHLLPSCCTLIILLCSCWWPPCCCKG